MLERLTVHHVLYDFESESSNSPTRGLITSSFVCKQCRGVLLMLFAEDVNIFLKHFFSKCASDDTGFCWYASCIFIKYVQVVANEIPRSQRCVTPTLRPFIFFNISNLWDTGLVHVCKAITGATDRCEALNVTFPPTERQLMNDKLKPAFSGQRTRRCRKSFIATGSEP